VRNGVLWAVLALILVSVNALVLDKEAILSDGELMLLRLAPRDPRSLMQGDYMLLRYSVADDIAHRLASVPSASGEAVVRLDRHQVAQLVRLHDEARPLAAGERLLHFRKRGDRVRLAGDAFFFQEGEQALYSGARYGELRVDGAGNAVLTGLRGEGRERLGPRRAGEGRQG
jgi:uncharacterized membrane-anchored protein